MTVIEQPGSNPVYEAAERLARLGISTIPIAPGTKEPPRGFAWGVYARRLADLSERYEWFVERGWQLAVVPGTVSGNLVPLDFDGAGGFDSLAERYPVIRSFPRVRTGSGKRHVWVRTRRPTRKYVCAAPDGSKLEVRAGTHYTLCPPSLHPSGAAYAWEVEPWDGIPVIDLTDIGLKQVETTEAEQAAPYSEGAPLTEAERDHIIALVSPHYVPYSRHELCLALAGWLAGHGVPETDAVTVVAALAEEAGDRSRLREYQRGVRTTYQRAREGVAVAGWARLTDGADPLVSEATAKALDLLMRGRMPTFTLSRPDEATRTTPWLISVADLLAEPDEPDVWLCEGIWRDQTLGLIVGPPKTFKSFFAQELAVALATGTPLFGVFAVPEPVTVIYVQEESARKYLRRRFDGILRGRGMHRGMVAETLYTITNERFRLDDEAHLARLVTEGVDPHAPKLVLFDPLREMHWQDENKAEAMMPILQRLKSLRDTYNLSVGVIHHNNKNPLYTKQGESVRGTTAIWGAMDAGLFVETTETEGQVKVKVNQKEGGAVAPFLYSVRENDGAIAFDIVDLDGQRKTVSDEIVLEHLRNLGWAEIGEISRVSGFSPTTVRRHLQTMGEKGGVKVRTITTGGRPKNLYAVRETDDDAPDF